MSNLRMETFSISPLSILTAEGFSYINIFNKISCFLLFPLISSVFNFMWYHRKKITYQYQYEQKHIHFQQNISKANPAIHEKFYIHYGSVGKESACNAGDLSSIPGLGRHPGEGNGYPLQYSDLENSVVFVVHGGRKESDTAEQLSFLHYY